MEQETCNIFNVFARKGQFHWHNFLLLVFILRTESFVKLRGYIFIIWATNIKMEVLLMLFGIFALKYEVLGI